VTDMSDPVTIEIFLTKDALAPKRDQVVEVRGT